MTTFEINQKSADSFAENADTAQTTHIRLYMYGVDAQFIGIDVKNRS